MNFKTAALCLSLIACTGEKTGTGFNLFTIEDDIALGQDLEAEIAADPENYPVLSQSAYPEAYRRINLIRDRILETGEVEYSEEIEWTVKIIHDDETLNAFCAPGGYIYVYTGLMKFLTTEDELAGVMGHEIAHADLRHSTEQLTKAYGIAFLLEVLLDDDPGLLADIAAALTNLSFSRADETEADAASVEYLCQTQYAADGAAGFFEKLEQLDSFELPEFLSTHPSSETRIEDIQSYAANLDTDGDGEPDCSLEQGSTADYEQLLNALP